MNYYRDRRKKAGAKQAARRSKFKEREAKNLRASQCASNSPLNESEAKAPSDVKIVDVDVTNQDSVELELVSVPPNSKPNSETE